METLAFIGTYIIPLFTAAVGWLVGSRKRKNDFLKDLQASIDLLSSENRKTACGHNGGELRDCGGQKRERGTEGFCR